MQHWTSFEFVAKLCNNCTRTYVCFRFSCLAYLWDSNSIINSNMTTYKLYIEFLFNILSVCWCSLVQDEQRCHQMNIIIASSRKKIVHWKRKPSIERNMIYHQYLHFQIESNISHRYDCRLYWKHHKLRFDFTAHCCITIFFFLERVPKYFSSFFFQCLTWHSNYSKHVNCLLFVVIMERQ